MENTPKEKETKTRSRLYPRYDLEEVITFIGIVNTLGGNRVSSDAVAAHMGKAVNNSTFIGRVSSAKQFGLINQESGKLSLSPLGKEIAFPRDESSKVQAIRKAFVAPQLYGELVEVFKGKKLPEVQTLGNLLVHDYGIEAAAKDTAARNFVRSAEYSGMMQNEILVLSELQGTTEVIPTETTVTPSKVTEKIPSLSSAVRVEEVDSFVFNFKGGIKLIIPRNEMTSNAIADGDLKDARTALTAFSNAHLKEVVPEVNISE